VALPPDYGKNTVVAGAGAEERSETPRKTNSLWKRLRRGVIVAGLALVLVYAYMMATAGGSNLFETLGELDLKLLVLPLIATLLSYVTMSLSYEGIARAAGSDIRQRDMLRITFVANTANYVLPTGGLSGFALRMVMLNKKNVSAGRAVLISFTQTLLTNLMLMVFIVYGLIHLILSRQLETLTVLFVLIVIAVLTVFLGGCLAMVYRVELRTRLLARLHDLTSRALRRFGHYERYERRVRHFYEHIDEGMRFFAARPRAMIGPLAWIFMDWVFTIGVLYAAFYSVGSNVTYSQVMIAFSVGIVFAVISFVPGGVGVLEVALSSMFESSGVPRHETVLAILIFRISFYVIPVLLALIVARGAFSEVDESAAEEML